MSRRYPRVMNKTLMLLKLNSQLDVMRDDLKENRYSPHHLWRVKAAIKRREALIEEVEAARLPRTILQLFKKHTSLVNMGYLGSSK